MFLCRLEEYLLTPNHVIVVTAEDKGLGESICGNAIASERRNRNGIHSKCGTVVEQYEVL